MEKRRKGFCPLWRTCVLWLDGCQSCQHTNFLKIPRLWDGCPLSAPWVVNLQLCQEQLSRDLLAAGLIVSLWDSELFFSFFFFSFVILLPHLTLNKCKLVQVGPVWYLDLVSVRNRCHRIKQSHQLKASLQRENLVIYKREKQSGLAMIPPEIKSIFLHYVWLTVNRGVLNVMLPTCESLDCIPSSHLTSA